MSTEDQNLPIIICAVVSVTGFITMIVTKGPKSGLFYASGWKDQYWILVMIERTLTGSGQHPQSFALLP